MEFNNTIRSIENSVIMLLPYGTYSATLCTVNNCGKTCKDYGPMSIVERQQETTLIPKPQQETTPIPEPQQETCIGEDNTIIILCAYSNVVHNYSYYGYSKDQRHCV